MKGILDDNKVQKPKQRVWKLLLVAGVIMTGLLAIGNRSAVEGAIMVALDKGSDSLSLSNACSQPEKLIPANGEVFRNLSYFKSEEYRNFSLNSWSGAIQVVTPSYDDLGPIGEDSRWDSFYEFETYLKDSFPTVHEIADLEHINTHGLLYTWKGSDESLKPVLFMGHQDVVPVPDETVSRWTYPPFSGHYDGEFVWGRGSNDCKNNVIGLFEALEVLAKDGFQPSRTIMVSLGFDEEVSGYQGGGELGPAIFDKLGPDSIYAIVDEGGLGIQDAYNTRFAMPSTGEKGYTDITISVATSGGHSSMPPDHTAIGIASLIVVALENSPFSPVLTDHNPFYQQLQCYATHGNSIDSKLKKNILNMGSSKKAWKAVIKEVLKQPVMKFLVMTSKAVDIIKGGIKVNALPEEVSVTINSRIAVEQDLEFAKSSVVKTLYGFARRFDFGIEAFGVALPGFEDTTKGVFKVTSHGDLEPAPITSIENNPTWDVLAGTIKHVFEDFASYPESELADGSPVIVTPSLMTGNTDTKFYWELTKNIYRFTPIRQVRRFNAHAIDERVELNAHIEGAVFFYEFIRNADAAV